LILPPALLDDEHVVDGKGLGEGSVSGEIVLVGVVVSGSDAAGVVGPTPHAAPSVSASSCPRGSRPGITHKCDPYGRDGSSSSSRCRPETKHGWSPEPLAQYLTDAVMQIDSNLRDEQVPTSERLQEYVTKLVDHTRRRLKHAPKKDRLALQALFTQRLQRFWDFGQNQKARSTTPEVASACPDMERDAVRQLQELKSALVAIVENLLVDFAMNTDTLLLAQPKPLRVGVESAGG